MKQDDLIVLIDDLITTGESKLEARAAILAECEARGITVQIRGITCLFDREEGGIEFLTKEGLNINTVFTIASYYKHSVPNLPLPLLGNDNTRHWQSWRHCPYTAF